MIGDAVSSAVGALGWRGAYRAPLPVDRTAPERPEHRRWTDAWPDAILDAWARESYPGGSYEGRVVARARSAAGAERAVKAGLDGLGHGAQGAMLLVRQLEPYEAPARDPYRWTAEGAFRSADEGDARKVARAAKRTGGAGYVAPRSAMSEREVEAELRRRAPLSAPTWQMWRAAIGSGACEGPAARSLEDVAAGKVDPGRRCVSVAYQLLKEENARRARTR